MKFFAFFIVGFLGFSPAHAEENAFPKLKSAYDSASVSFELANLSEYATKALAEASLEPSDLECLGAFEDESETLRSFDLIITRFERYQGPIFDAIDQRLFYAAIAEGDIPSLFDAYQSIEITKNEDSSVIVSKVADGIFHLENKKIADRSFYNVTDYTVSAKRSDDAVHLLIQFIAHPEQAKYQLAGYCYPPR